MATKALRVDFTEGAAPATPAAGDVRLYAKSDGLLYSKDDAGVETKVSVGSAGLGAWTNYTPTWFTNGAGADPTLGNGSLVGRYKLLDETTMVLNIYLLFGSTSNGGSGDWVFNLPSGYTTAASRKQQLSGHILDAGSDHKLCVAFIDGLGTGFFVAPEAGNVVTATAPMTWANGDTLTFGGILEVVAP